MPAAYAIITAKAFEVAVRVGRAIRDSRLAPQVAPSAE